MPLAPSPRMHAWTFDNSEAKFLHRFTQACSYLHTSMQLVNPAHWRLQHQHYMGTYIFGYVVLLLEDIVEVDLRHCGAYDILDIRPDVVLHALGEHLHPCHESENQQDDDLRAEEARRAARDAAVRHAVTKVPRLFSAEAGGVRVG